VFVGALSEENYMTMNNEKLAMSNEDIALKDFIETRIITAIRELLTGRVNEILGNSQYLIPVIEFGTFSSSSIINPVISLAGCERTEKERIIRLDVFMLTVAFSLPEIPESELFCYAYSAATDMALKEDVTLGGVADRAVITEKKYVPPKKANCGQGWELNISLRITVEGMAK
jgi:hypothetical protein